MLALSSFLAVAVSELGSAVFFVLGMMALKLLPLLALLAQVQLPVSLGETMLNRNASRKHTCFTHGTTRFLYETTEPKLDIGLVKAKPPTIKVELWNLSIHCPAVEGRNPQQPPGMYKTLYGYLPTQLVQDFFHQQHHWEKNPIFLWLRYVQVLVSGVTPKIFYTWCSLAISQFNLQDASLPPI